jgi:hypothetical protein
MAKRQFNLKLQRGLTLILWVFMLGIVAAAYMLRALNGDMVKTERGKETAVALAEAKTALIGWAATRSTPGQLPCPEDTTLIGSVNEGNAKSSCTLPAIGRLPWRSLGIGDVRGGNGERLWYVISPGFRTPPINSDSPAQLTVDGVAGSAVAIIFSPGLALAGQTRPVPTSANPPDVTQYLDLSNSNGNGPFVTTGAADSFNDRLLIISHDELFGVVEKRVAREVINALNDYFATNGFYPLPADFTNSACFGNSAISIGCDSMVSGIGGRMPANPATPWNTTSILRGTIGAGNWFQSNAWREVTYYGVSSLCGDGTSNCATGDLTLLNPPSTPMVQQKVVVIMGGRTLGASRDPATLGDYLEDENASPSDRVFSRVPTTSVPFNDIAVAIP